MVNVSLEQLKELRRRTGAGVLKCRQALEKAGGQMERAEEWLREEARAEAARRAAKHTGEGLVGSYVHHTGKMGALVEVACETDFVARTKEFRELVGYLAEQVAASAPAVVEESSAPEGTGESESALLAQSWIRDPSRSIGQLVAETAARVGERLEIRRFVRFDLSEPL